MGVQTDHGSYGQFCPVAMAAEVICSRWTALILREMLCGSTRFNDLRRGVPKMSPTLLSKRLKELEEAGVIASRPAKQGVVEYKLTERGEDLREVIMSIGNWGHRWIESGLSLKNLDPSLLMWDMRRHLIPSVLPDRRCVIRFDFTEPGLERKATYWLVVDKGKVDLCNFDPGYEVDLFVRGSLRAMTSVWMGVTSMRTEIGTGHLEVSGDRAIERSMQAWLGLSPFAKEKRRVA